MISFGPIPSRRLGKSLGINNITSTKTCSYSCIYCQVGLTHNYSFEREVFYEPSVIFDEVQEHLSKLAQSDKPDYLTFVANGEPTLDIHLGESIEKLKILNIPIAVITNASLLNDPQVREELQLADWVSVKIDVGNESIWKKINRPLAKVDFKEYVKGLITFSKEFKGILVSETMLVEGVNDNAKDVLQTATLVSTVNPSIAYISVPTRPPALNLVVPPNELIVNEAYQIFSDKGINTELILGFEGTHTGFTGNALEDIINICSVHPIREDTMQELLKKNQVDQTILETLLYNKYVQKIEYNSNTFYIRKFRH
ncbi:MAG: radical SAM protein [Paludibacter sp.]|nr:radical SAM protein [Paludibacter sp.]